MNKRQKISILKKALGFIRSGQNALLCRAIYRAGDNSLSFSEVLLAKYGIKKPKVLHNGLVWWRLDFKGKATRIRILRNAIKRLQN